MAKLAAFSLAVWLLVLVSSIQLVHACFGCSDIQKILDMVPEERDESQKTKLLKAAKKALSNEKIMSIETALEIFLHRYDLFYKAELDGEKARDLINIHTVTREKCDAANLMSKDFAATLHFVTKNRSRFRVLYKHVKASLNHFTAECGLQERYEKIVQFLSSKSGESSADEKSTLADQLLGDSSDSLQRIFHFSRESANVIRFLRDPKFTNEIKCGDEETIAEIWTWSGLEYFKWAREYVHHVFENYLEICDYEKRFQLVAGLIPKEMKRPEKTLASFLERRVCNTDISVMLLMLKHTGLIATGESDCDKVDRDIDLSEEIMAEAWARGSSLEVYSRYIMQHNKSICGPK